MKRPIFLMLCLLAAILLTACGGRRENPNIFEKDGFTVNREAGTITHGEDVYTYEISGGGSGSSIRITYPNGAAYFWEWTGNGGHGGWSDDYDPVRYTDGDTLIDLVNFQPPRESSGNPLLGLLVIALGIFNLAVPRTAWYLSYGWRFKDAEPSDAALVLGRIGGGIAVFAGLLLFFL